MQFRPMQTTYLMSITAAVFGVINDYYFFDPGTQFPGKKNYAMQRQNIIIIIIIITVKFCRMECTIVLNFGSNILLPVKHYFQDNGYCVLLVSEHHIII